MINKNFFPTPEDLAIKLLAGLDIGQIHSLLEPGAGKGDLITAFKNYVTRNSYSNHEIDIDCIEIEPELRACLEGQKLTVIHDDFMTYQALLPYDLILANFPFCDDADVSHLLKAISLQERFGGEIRAIIAARSIKQATTSMRRTLVEKLTYYGADIEYVENAFSEAERKTGIEVALVKVSIPKPQRKSLILDDLESKNYERKNDGYQNQVISGDYLEGVIEQYNFEIEAGINLINEWESLAPLMKVTFDKNDRYSRTLISLDVCGEKSYKSTIGRFVESVRYKYWVAFFENPKLVGKLTESMRQNWMSKIRELIKYDFSVKNIYNIRCQMASQVLDDMKENALKAFEDFTYTHSWYPETTKNRYLFNGWKSNDAFKINPKKIILPHCNCFDNYNSEFRIYYDITRKFQDYEKILDFVMGDLSKDNQIDNIFKEASEQKTSKGIVCKYFSLTFYKKGTCHVEWSDLGRVAIQKLNLLGSSNRAWLPPTYGKCSYEDLCEEDKIIIDSYEGKAGYEKVLANPSLMDVFNSVTLLEQIA